MRDGMMRDERRRGGEEERRGVGMHSKREPTHRRVVGKKILVFASIMVFVAIF